MRKLFLAMALAALATPGEAATHHKLMVLSIDGLDWRYIRDADL